MEERRFGLSRLFAPIPKMIMLAMNPVLLLMALLAWLILGEAIVTVQAKPPPQVTRTVS
ncbi:MAG: hypothetical protein U1F27_04225 [Turneriella sp.]